MTVYLGGRVCLSLTGPCVIDSGVNEGPPQLANRTLARLMCAHLPGRIISQIYTLVHSRGRPARVGSPESTEWVVRSDPRSRLSLSPEYPRISRSSGRSLGLGWISKAKGGRDVLPISKAKVE
jgi:hypothetical protein